MQSQEVLEQKDHISTAPVLKVTLLGSEWISSAGGLSTLNRELAIHLSKHPKVEVSFLVPEGACKDEEKREAQSYDITVVDAKKRPGYDPLDWLSFPPQNLRMDIVVGHGVKLGRQGHVIRDSAQFHSCKWVQVVHTAPEDLSRYKGYPDPISKGEKKHEAEVDLCKLADLVVPVGPRLEEAYSSYLRRCKENQDVFSVTPGLFDREFGDLDQAPNENSEFKVLLFGRGDDEDFELKGYNIAATAFTDDRLKGKPYHLIFVGAPDGKQDEVRRKLLQCGIAEEQLTVRKFVQSREKMKDLLCEVDVAIMPSKSEGFGLVSLEALSAGLPILVGSKSGIAKALENVPFGKSCIVYSDSTAKWAKAIEGVRMRHKMWLEEIGALKASYEKKYSWKGQCEALVDKIWRMVHGSSNGNVKEPNVESSFEQQAAAVSPDRVFRPSSEQQAPLEEEKKAYGTNKEVASLSAKASLQTGSRPNILQSTPDLGTLLRLVITTQDLDDEQQEIVNDILTRQIQVYTKRHTLSSAEGVGALIQFILKAYNVALETVGMGSLEIIVQCFTLESLERLWNDCCSGYLNEAAERYLVSDEMKRKLNLEKIRLKTTIKEENYVMCKKALMEMSGTAGGIGFPSQQTEPDQGESARWTDTGTAGSTSFPSQQTEPDQGASARWTDTGTAGSTSFPSQQTEPDQGASARWTDTGAAGSTSFPSQQTEPDQGAGAGWTDTGTPGSTSFPSQQTEPDQGESAKGTDTGTAGSTIFPSQQTEPDQGAGAGWTDTNSATSPDFQQSKKQDMGWVIRAEKTKASRGALHKASISGECDTVKMLLDSGEDVDQRDEFSLTALHLACWYGQESVVRLLLERGANVNAVDRFQHTPLQKAERHNHQSIVQLLLKNNARPSYQQPLNLKSLSRKAFLHVDKRSGLNLLQAAVFEGDYSTVFKAHALLNNFVKEMNFERTGNDARIFPRKTAIDILSSLDKKGGGHADIDKLYHKMVENVNTLTELHWCARSDDAEKAVELVLNDGVDINVPALCGRTPLFSASLSSSSESLKTIIDLGANVNVQRTDDEVAPLELAANWNNYMATHLLLEHGADANIQDIDGNAPLHESVRRGFFEVSQLLIESSANINLQNEDGSTPLHIAVEDNYENIVTLLLKNSADANIQDIDGETPLHESVCEGFFKVSQLLIESGCNIILQDQDGSTPLHIAVENNYENLVKLLLMNSADANIQDNDGDTPLHESVRGGFVKVYELLINSGGDINLQNKNGRTPNDIDLIRQLLLKDIADANSEDIDSQLLIELGGDKNLRKKSSRTPHASRKLCETVA